MYEPLWLTLADALHRVVATGLDEQKAKDLLCSAMGDRAIAVRIQIDSGDQDVGGRWLSPPSVDVPPRIRAEDLDWHISRPIRKPSPKQKGAWDAGAWVTGPVRPESYWALWDRRPRLIAVLELSATDIDRAFGAPHPDRQLVATVAEVPAVGGAAKPGKAAQTAEDKRAWKKWLVEQMKAAPGAARPKPEMERRGIDAGLPTISGRGFNSVFTAAAEAAGTPAWSDQGRRKKSPQPGG
jgi:hypothetical protein